MKRDMELIREILLEMEKSEHPLKAEVFATKEKPKKIVAYNMELMEEAGLVKLMKQAGDNDPYYFIQVQKITWEGYDFLANVRDDEVWKKVKLKIAQIAGDVSFSIIKNVAVQIVSQNLF